MKEKKLNGIVLQGGGARGSFHIGVMKALIEEGIEFNGIVGTSIGAFNAAMIAQGDFDKLYELWCNMNHTDLFDVDGDIFEKITNNEIDIEVLKYIRDKTKNIINNKGINTDKLKSILEENIDEEKLRNSNKDFGLITTTIPDLKQVEIYKEDIPNGRVNEYIMASASFPGFKLEDIDGKLYVDGGIRDNCPVNLLINKNYKNIIVIKTTKNEMLLNIKKNNKSKIMTITPSEDLGNILIFNNEVVLKNILLGYFDGKRAIRGLKGQKYYIKPMNEKLFFDILEEVPKKLIYEIGKTLNVSGLNYRRIMFEHIVPAIVYTLNLNNNVNYEDIVIALLEAIASRNNVYRFKIYDLKEFIEEINLDKSLQEYKKNIYKLNLKDIIPGTIKEELLDKLIFEIIKILKKELIN